MKSKTGKTNLQREKARILVILENGHERACQHARNSLYFDVGGGYMTLGYMQIFIHIKINEAVYLRCVYFTM